MVEVKTFKNKKGTDIKYLSIPNGKYDIKIGFKKAQAVFDHADEIKMILTQMDGA